MFSSHVCYCHTSLGFKICIAEILNTLIFHYYVYFPVTYFRASNPCKQTAFSNPNISGNREMLPHSCSQLSPVTIQPVSFLFSLVLTPFRSIRYAYLQHNPMSLISRIPTGLKELPLCSLESQCSKIKLSTWTISPSFLLLFLSAITNQSLLLSE